MNHRRIAVILVALVALAAGGVLAAKEMVSAESRGSLFAQGKKAELGVLKARDTEGGTLETAPPEIPAVRVGTVAQARTLRLTGSLVADEESDVASNINGIVESVAVERGSRVKKGDVLVQLDARDARNALAEGEAAVEELRVRLGLAGAGEAFDPERQPEVQTARAALDLAEKTCLRYENLSGQGIISNETSDKARTEYESAKQRYQQALHQTRQLYQSYKTALTRLNTLRKAVEDTTIRAPFDGWVLQRYTSVGERVMANPMGADSKIVTLTKLDPLRLVLTVPQQNSALVTEGQTVTFKVDGVPDRVFTGEIRYIAPGIQASSRSLAVEAMVSNPDGALRPGLFATAELVLPETTTRLVVPESALVRKGDVATVFVVKDGIAREQVTYTGEVEGGQVEIVSGLVKDDVVVTTPDRVYDGKRIAPCIN